MVFVLMWRHWLQVHLDLAASRRPQMYGPSWSGRAAMQGPAPYPRTAPPAPCLPRAPWIRFQRMQPEQCQQETDKVFSYMHMVTCRTYCIFQ